jgi:hypothetical protein
MMIRSLQSVVDRELAWRSLSPRGPLGIVRRWRAGKLLGLGNLYIPYRLYQVKVDDHRVHCTRFLAVDAISGGLDPYEFPESPMPASYAEVETANYLPARLGEDETRALVLEQMRRLVFSAGFFRLVKPAITAAVMGEFYIPYWAGFYGQLHDVSVLMLNAVRGTIEGSKASNLVKTWLLEHPSADIPTPR